MVEAYVLGEEVSQMGENLVSIFDESFRRIKVAEAREDEFFDRFYGIFMDSSQEVKDKFKNVDMSHQRQMLKKSFFHMIELFVRREPTEYMGKIAQIHSKKEKDIRPGLYDLWLECLVTAAEQCDPNFNSDVETAWRVVMAPGIEFMRSQYAPKG